MGKYSHVIDKLPRYMGEEPQYQKRIEATKDQVLASTRSAISDEQLAALVRALQNGLRQNVEPALKAFIEGAGDKRWASQYALIYKYLRDVKEELEAQLSNVNLVIEAYGSLLDAQLEVEGTSGVPLDNGWSVRVQKEPYTKIVDKDAFRKWCIANGYENEMQIMWQTANGICKELLLEGEPNPDGTELYSKPKIFVTKPRG